MTVTAIEAPTLVVSEVFGPTVQGEGPSAGRRCSFIRTGGCNLHCSWCDSAYTWDASRFDLRAELARRTVTDIMARVLEGDPGMVVISGGEPLLHQSQPGWVPLLAALTREGITIEVETNGTIIPAPATVAAVTRFNVSPKLAHAGDPEQLRLDPRALEAFRALAAGGRAVFKFVCTCPADVTEVTAIADAAHLPARAIWIMPEGVTPATVTAGLAALADTVIAAGYNLTGRLHVLAWGDERGR